MNINIQKCDYIKNWKQKIYSKLQKRCYNKFIDNLRCAKSSLLYSTYITFTGFAIYLQILDFRNL